MGSSIKDVRIEGGRGGLTECGQLRTGGEGGSEAKRTSAKKFKPVQLIFKMKHKKN